MPVDGIAFEANPWLELAENGEKMEINVSIVPYGDSPADKARSKCVMEIKSHHEIGVRDGLGWR